MLKLCAGIFLLSLFSIITTKECVVYLSTHNFTELVDRSFHSWLVMFIDEDCGYCKDIVPLFVKTAEDLCNEPDLHFGVVKLKGNSDLHYRFEIKTTLAFKLIKNGKVYTYDESYPVQNLTDFSQRGSALVTGEITPFYKSSLSKIYYDATAVFEGLLPIFDNTYLANHPSSEKVSLLILLLLAPMILAAILLYYCSSKVTTEDEQINVKVNSRILSTAGNTFLRNQR